MPALSVTLFLLIGTWALVPGAFHFTPRAVVNTIADRDFVATHDLLLQDDEATKAKQ